MDIIFRERQNAGDMATSISALSPYDPRMVGGRLRIAREILAPGGSQGDAAKLVDETVDRWSRMEVGETRVDFPLADKLHNLGIERDWLVYGSDRLVSPVLRQQIAEAEERISSAPARGRRTKTRA